MKHWGRELKKAKNALFSVWFLLPLACSELDKASLVEKDKRGHGINTAHSQEADQDRRAELDREVNPETDEENIAETAVESRTDGESSQDNPTSVVSPKPEEEKDQTPVPVVTTPPPPVQGARARARVFISGHSLTDNPVADYLGNIAQSLSRDYSWNQQIGIGSPIRIRTKGLDLAATGWPGYSRGKNRVGSDMNVINELRQPRTLGAGERYDTLVITERHDILGSIEYEDTVPYLRHFHDRLIEGNPDGHSYFFHSWWNINKEAPAAWIDYEKKALFVWECAAAKVNLTLAANNRRDRVSTLPAGAALVELVERIIAGEVRGIAGSIPQRMNAIFSDNVHMTPLGAYYISLVSYAAVFRSSPEGSPSPTGIDSATASDFQRIAWRFISSYFASPREPTMESCRRRVSEDFCGPFWTMQGRPEVTASCQRSFLDPAYVNNPFRWPDPQLKVFPVP